MRIWTQQEEIFENALGGSIWWWSSGSAKENVLIDAALRSRLEVIYLQFEYLNLPRGEGSHAARPSRETTAEHIFAAFPCLKTLKITTYGSKGHYILTQGVGIELAPLKLRLSRLVGSIPKHVKVILSNDCPKSEVTILDPERAHSLVQEAWNHRPEIRRPVTLNVKIATLTIPGISSFCHATTGSSAIPVSSPIETIVFTVCLDFTKNMTQTGDSEVELRTKLIYCLRRLHKLRTVRFQSGKANTGSAQQASKLAALEVSFRLSFLVQAYRQHDSRRRACRIWGRWSHRSCYCRWPR